MADEMTPGRRYQQDEVARIIRLAGEMQEKHGGLPPGRDGVTLAEIQQVAAEVGISPDWIREAAARADLPAPSPPAKPQRRSRLYGRGRQFRCEVTLSGGPVYGPMLASLPPVIHDVIERHGESRVTRDGLEWVHVTGAGTVRVTIGGDRDSTQILAEADRTSQARRNLLWGALGGGTILGLIGASSGDAGIFFLMSTMGLGGGGVAGRLWWNRQSEKWRKRLNVVVQRLSESVAARLGDAGRSAMPGAIGESARASD